MKRKETNEQKVERWIAGSVKSGLGAADIASLGWEAGQVGAIEAHGLNYECFKLPTGGYVVVEWDVDGNVCVL